MAKWNTPQGFLEATLGKSYDMDGVYGKQCWDYMDFFWLKQVGRTLVTKPGGNGTARDCWTVSRKVNAGSEFSLVTSKSQLKVGDVVVFNGGKFGHIGMVYAVKTAGVTVVIQGQNQGTIKSKVTRVTLNLGDFLGAFRFKAWHTKKQSFLPARGYWKRGDNDERIGQVAKFMRNTFPAYTPAAALGNYFGKYLEASIKQFQKNTKLKADGCIGPKTYDKLKAFGFKG